MKVEEGRIYNWSDQQTVQRIALCVYGNLPRREWESADTYVVETCGLIGVNMLDGGYGEVLMSARLMEETLREDIGDE